MNEISIDHQSYQDFSDCLNVCRRVDADGEIVDTRDERINEICRDALSADDLVEMMSEGDLAAWLSGSVCVIDANEALKIDVTTTMETLHALRDSGRLPHAVKPGFKSAVKVIDLLLSTQEGCRCYVEIVGILALASLEDESGIYRQTKNLKPGILAPVDPTAPSLNDEWSNS